MKLGEPRYKIITKWLWFLGIMVVIGIFCVKDVKAVDEDLTKTININYPTDTSAGKTNGVAVAGAAYTFTVVGAPAGSCYEWTTSGVAGSWSGGGSSSSATFSPLGTSSSTSYSFTVKVFGCTGPGGGSPWTSSGSETLNNPVITFNQPSQNVFVCPGEAIPVEVTVTNPGTGKTLAGVTVEFLRSPALGSFSPTSTTTATGGIATSTYTASTTAGDVVTLQAKCGPTTGSGPQVTVGEVVVKEISFTSDHTMYENGDHDGWGPPGAQITDPVWKNVNNPDKPVCYTKGTSLSMTVKLGVNPVPSPAQTITLKVDGPGNLDGQTNISLNAAEVTASITTTGTLDAKVYKLNPASLTWSHSCYDGITFRSLGNSSHRIYVTFNTPFPTTELTEKRINKCVTDANNATTSTGVADAIHPISGAQFNGGTGTTAKNFGVTPATDVSTNWYMFSPDTTNWDIQGSCAAYASINKMMLDLLGVLGGTVVYIYASSDCTGLEASDQSSYQTQTFVCQGQDKNAKLIYCDGTNGNNWEGTLKFSGKYYGGAATCEGSTALSILQCVANSQFWMWIDSVASSCKETYCNENESVKNGPHPGVPSSCP